MAFTVKPVTRNSHEGIGQLFASGTVAAACWCMWFIKPVTDFHTAGSEGNQAHFRQLLETSEHPLGLLAYQDDQVLGWCAVGPRQRYMRAMKTPTYRAAVEDKDAAIWLIPCLYIHEDARGAGLSEILIGAAVQLAQKNGAVAIDSFPLARRDKPVRGETQMGFESSFSACGFKIIHTPSASRVVMRQILSDLPAYERDN